MDEALIGAAGLVVGAVLGSTFKYFTTRRDAWILARAHGLLLLADVRATLAPRPTGEIADIAPLLASWQANRQVLAGFRRGSFPSGFRAPEWLALAAGFARLAVLDGLEQGKRDERWQATVGDEVRGVEALLERFASDPKVFGYVVRAGVTGHPEGGQRPGPR